MSSERSPSEEPGAVGEVLDLMRWSLLRVASCRFLVLDDGDDGRYAPGSVLRISEENVSEAIANRALVCLRSALYVDTS